jgi:hypothetical protein
MIKSMPSCIAVMECLTICLLACTIIVSIPYSNASSRSPYDSGYDHGCDDAKISDPNDRYINQPEKGTSFHTDEFMRGYNYGYDACSNDSNNSEFGDGTEGCFDDGYEDGRDNPFDIDEYDKCGGSSGGPGNNAYYNGFVAGCLSVKGNTAEVCEKATDS